MMKQVQKKMMAKKDTRMKFCTELLNNIKIFKLYNWENIIARRAEGARAEEMKYTTSYITVLTCVFVLSWGSRYYVMMSMLVTMALYGITFESGPIFTTLSVIRVLVTSVTIVPNIVNNFIQMLISMDRMQKFLKTKNYEEYIASRERAEASRNTDVKI
jgi:hypothetical protein